MTVALLVSLWQRSRPNLLVLAIALGLAALAAVLVPIPEKSVPIVLDLGQTFVWMAVAMCGAVLLPLAEGSKGHGFDARLFVLPVSSARLASVWIVFLAGVPAATYLMGSTILVYAAGAGAPNVGAVLAIAAVMGWVACIVWNYPGERPMAMSAMVVFGLVIYGYLWLRFGLEGLFNPLKALGTWNVAEITTVGALFAASIPIGAAWIGRHRHSTSERGRFVQLRRLVPSLRTQAATSRSPFGSSVDALLWVGLKENGHLVPALFLLPWLVLLPATIFGLIGEAFLGKTISALSMATAIFAPLLAAGSACRDSQGRLCAPLAEVMTLRPVPSSTIAGVHLGQSVLGLVVAWGLTLGGTFAVWSLADHSGAASAASIETLDFVLTGLPAALPTLVTLSLIVTGTLTALLLSGRLATLGLGGFLVLGALVAWGLLSTLTPAAADWVRVLAPAGWMAFIGLGLVVILKTVRMGLMRVRTLLVQSIVVAGLAAAIWLAAPTPPEWLFFTALTAGLVLPWPAAALTVHWNRHR